MAKLKLTFLSFLRYQRHLKQKILSHRFLEFGHQNLKHNYLKIWTNNGRAIFRDCSSSPYVRESMKVLDSRSQPLDSGSQHLDSGFQPFGFRIPTFWIPYQSGFRIPNHCGFWILVSGFQIPTAKICWIPDSLTWGEAVLLAIIRHIACSYCRSTHTVSRYPLDLTILPHQHFSLTQSSTPKNDQLQFSLSASQFAQMKVDWTIISHYITLIIFFLNGWENLHYELGIERVNSVESSGGKRQVTLWQSI